MLLLKTLRRLHGHHFNMSLPIGAESWERLDDNRAKWPVELEDMEPTLRLFYLRIPPELSSMPNRNTCYTSGTGLRALYY